MKEKKKKKCNTDIKSYLKYFQKLNKDILLINIVYHLTRLLEENKQLSQISVAFDAKKSANTAVLQHSSMR